MLQNWFFIRKKFVPVKFIRHIYIYIYIYISLSKYYTIVSGTPWLHQEEAFKRQRIKHPGDVFQVCDCFSVASYPLVLSSKPWFKLCALRKRTKIQRNWLPGFAAGCHKVLKTKRIFLEGLSLAATERNFQYKLLCVKSRNTAVCSLYDTVMSMRELMSRRMKTKLPLHTITPGLSCYLNWAAFV